VLSRTAKLPPAGVRTSTSAAFAPATDIANAIESAAASGRCGNLGII
jgi:hypothetical protein